MTLEKKFSSNNNLNNKNSLSESSSECSNMIINNNNGNYLMTNHNNNNSETVILNCSENQYCITSPTTTGTTMMMMSSNSNNSQKITLNQNNNNNNMNTSCDGNTYHQSQQYQYHPNNHHHHQLLSSSLSSMSTTTATSSTTPMLVAVATPTTTSNQNSNNNNIQQQNVTTTLNNINHHQQHQNQQSQLKMASSFNLNNHSHNNNSHPHPPQQVNHKNNNNITSATSNTGGNVTNNNGTSSNFLCDISNLTTEEKRKLDEIRQKRNKLLLEIQKLKEEISSVKKEMSRLDHNNACSTAFGDSASLSSGISSANDQNASTQRLKQLSIGKKKFNMDPKKGIEYLVMNNLIANTPEEIAKFLYKGEGLNKTAIGTYLGEKIDFNLKVLNHFIELHDFKKLLLVQALRQFLWSFRLPGEAQKIDRMMEKFAAHYCKQNPGVFSNTDTCFVLSFSIIMLNTSLHNPNVKDKMTAEKFIQMNRGINNGGDLDRELLLSLYDNIRQEPFKIPEDDGNDLMHTFFNPDREGYLYKQGGRYKNWKRRYFILNDKCLYYFECSTDKEPRGIIPLENVDIREVAGGRQHCFELYSAISDVIKACKTDQEGRVIEGRHSVYRLSAATEEEKNAWVKSIQTSVSRNPFYEMLAARKRKAQQN